MGVILNLQDITTRPSTTLQDVLRDPIWQFVGVVATLIAMTNQQLESLLKVRSPTLTIEISNLLKLNHKQDK